MISLKLKSPAKINLNLQILDKREDGYHNLKSEFCTINLFDKITLTKIPEGIQMVTSGKYRIPNNRDNLVYQVAEKLRSHAKGKVGVKIEIDKQIPLFAGLGGGSSNAATVLKGLIELWNLDLSLEKQVEIGKKIGADVPFFLYGAHCLVEGIGEKVTPLEDKIQEKYIVVVQLPYIKISTPWAYNQWDKLSVPLSKGERLAESGGSKPQGMSSNSKISNQKDITQESNKKTIKVQVRDIEPAFKTTNYPLPTNHSANDFEKVIFPHFPDLADLKESFLQAGASKACMTGSGSAVYGIFGEKEVAEGCLGEIGGECEFVWLGELI